jgi:GTP-binding protein
MKILSAEFIISAPGAAQFPDDAKPQIAFVGRSNVGKSSIINALLHRRNLAKTSSTPGKTQLINFFLVNGAFYFVDLPGYGYARVPRSVTDAWAPMIEGYLRDARRLAAVVALLDCRRAPDERDARLAEWLRQYSIPAVYILTKTDKINRRETDRAGKAYAEGLGLQAPPLSTSATSGQGLGELRGEIDKYLQKK